MAEYMIYVLGSGQSMIYNITENGNPSQGDTLDYVERPDLWCKQGASSSLSSHPPLITPGAVSQLLYMLYVQGSMEAVTACAISAASQGGAGNIFHYFDMWISLILLNVDKLKRN